jgi:hypothetical protein
MSPNLIKPVSRTRRRLVFRASAKSMTVILGALSIEEAPVRDRTLRRIPLTRWQIWSRQTADPHLWITDYVLKPGLADVSLTFPMELLIVAGPATHTAIWSTQLPAGSPAGFLLNPPSAASVS